MEIQKSKVYVLLDERSRVLRCEGGYTMSNIDDVSKWTYIDEGTGGQIQSVSEPLSRWWPAYPRRHPPV